MVLVRGPPISHNFHLEIERSNNAADVLVETIVANSVNPANSANSANFANLVNLRPLPA